MSNLVATAVVAAAEMGASSASSDLVEAVSAHLAHIESQLAELDAALTSGDGDRIAQQSQALQLGLSKGLAVFRQAEVSGSGLTTSLKRRLALAGTRCMQQQQAVQRVTASLGRTLGVLFPSQDGTQSATYGVPGQGLGARVIGAYR